MISSRQIMIWYKQNLHSYVNEALEHKIKPYLQSQKNRRADFPYNEEWLIAIAYRETWTLVKEYIKNKILLKNILPVVRGDYSQRDGEFEKSFHGFGFWQIDIGSYPEFVKSGDWKDPFKCCCKAIDVLEEKRLYLQQYFPDLEGEPLHRAITAAYNCGQGNVRKALTAKLGVDYYTHEKNYSRMVWEYRALYRSLNEVKQDI